MMPWLGRFLALCAVGVALVWAGGYAFADHTKLSTRVSRVTLQRPVRVSSDADLGLPSTRVSLPSGQLRVFFLGDSLRAGFGATTRARSWESRVVRALSRTRRLTVIDARGRLEQGQAFARSFQKFPSGIDLAVLEVGSSDFNNTPVEQFAADYGHIVESLRAKSPRMALLCLSTWHSPEWDFGSLQYNQVIADQCRGGRYVDIAGYYDDPALRGPLDRATWAGPGDDFHPNDVGHEVIADQILSNLKY